MILKYKYRGGQIRNTEKPYFIEICFKNSRLRNREIQWDYYRSYRTISNMVDAFQAFRKSGEDVCMRWTDFSTWPLSVPWGKGLESLIIEKPH